MLLHPRFDSYMLHIQHAFVLPSPYNHICQSASCRAAPPGSTVHPLPSWWLQESHHQLILCQEGMLVEIGLLLWWLARAVSKSRENKLHMMSVSVFDFL